MTTADLSLSFLVEQSPMQVWEAIQNVRGWWSTGITGSASEAGDEFIYRYKDLHYSKQRVIRSVPGKSMEWLVLDSRLNFLADKTEWNDTRISFEINEKDHGTELCFIHFGLVPEVECYDACTKGWTNYVEGSLRSLITTGKGRPD